MYSRIHLSRHCCKVAPEAIELIKIDLQTFVVELHTDVPNACYQCGS